MTASLVDIGANLTKPVFQADFDAVLARAAAAGVSAIVVTGTTLLGSHEACRLAQRRAHGTMSLFATAGVHPHYATTLSPQAISELQTLLARPEVVAVGECGLDYHRNLSPPDVQRRSFEAQLELAAAVRKPVFLHDRSATADFADILRRWRTRITGGVVHCFTGDRAALDAYLALDMHIGITGWICDSRRGSHLRDLVKLVPRGRLLVETDAPFLMPQDLPNPPPRRGKFDRNEPAFVAHVARVVAEHRGESFEDQALRRPVGSRGGLAAGGGAACAVRPRVKPRGQEARRASA